VYVDIGLTGSGQVWTDAIILNSSTTSATVSFSVGSDSANHIIEFYSVDNSDNVEVYNCATSTNCLTFKSDLTEPGNWHDAGAFRSALPLAITLI
jgi:hypothetical protein